MSYESRGEYRRRMKRQNRGIAASTQAEHRTRNNENLLGIKRSFSILRDAGFPNTTVLERTARTRSRIIAVGFVAMGRDVEMPLSKYGWKPVVLGTQQGYVIDGVISETHGDSRAWFETSYPLAVSTHGNFYKVTEKIPERDCVAVAAKSCGNIDNGIGMKYGHNETSMLETINRALEAQVRNLDQI